MIGAYCYTSYAPDGASKALKISLHDKYGSSHRFKTSVIRKAVLSFKDADGKSDSAMYETFAKYIADGGIGYGIAEYLVRKSQVDDRNSFERLL